MADLVQFQDRQYSLDGRRHKSIFCIFLDPEKIFFLGFSFWKSLYESKGGKKMKKWNVQTIVLTAMLAGLAGALMSLEFSLPMMPPFYKIDFSDVPSIIALFSLGPVSATLVEVIKLVVKVVTVGTNTGREISSSSVRVFSSSM